MVRERKTRPTNQAFDEDTESLVLAAATIASLSTRTTVDGWFDVLDGCVSSRGRRSNGGTDEERGKKPEKDLGREHIGV